LVASLFGQWVFVSKLPLFLEVILLAAQAWATAQDEGERGYSRAAKYGGTAF
jgi:hypothetical protein